MLRGFVTSRHRGLTGLCQAADSISNIQLSRLADTGAQRPLLSVSSSASFSTTKAAGSPEKPNDPKDDVNRHDSNAEDGTEHGNKNADAGGHYSPFDVRLHGAGSPYKVFQDMTALLLRATAADEPFYLHLKDVGRPSFFDHLRTAFQVWHSEKGMQAIELDHSKEEFTEGAKTAFEQVWELISKKEWEPLRSMMRLDVIKYFRDQYDYYQHKGLELRIDSAEHVGVNWVKFKFVSPHTLARVFKGALHELEGDFEEQVASQEGGTATAALPPPLELSVWETIAKGLHPFTGYYQLAEVSYNAVLKSEPPGPRSLVKAPDRVGRTAARTGSLRLVMLQDGADSAALCFKDIRELAQIKQQQSGRLLAQAEDLRPQIWVFARGPLPSDLPVRQLNLPWRLMTPGSNVL